MLTPYTRKHTHTQTICSFAINFDYVDNNKHASWALRQRQVRAICKPYEKGVCLSLCACIYLYTFIRILALTAWLFESISKMCGIFVGNARKIFLCLSFLCDASHMRMCQWRIERRKKKLYNYSFLNFVSVRPMNILDAKRREIQSIAVRRVWELQTKQNLYRIERIQLGLWMESVRTKSKQTQQMVGIPVHNSYCVCHLFHCCCC